MILLWFSIIFLTLIATGIATFPWWKRYNTLVFSGNSFVIALAMLVIIPAISIPLYLHWGDATGVRQYKESLVNAVRVEQFLKEYKSPEQLITKMQAILKTRPNSAQGWYLLGRLYQSNQQNAEAISALSKANTLQPNNILIEFHLAEALFQSQGFLNSKAQNLLKQVLKQQPNDPNVLYLFALNAYKQHYYQQAISLWEQILRQVPPDAPIAKSLLQSIANAQKKLGATT